MRLLIIGSLGGQIGAASRIAMDRGAKVLHADDISGGLEVLRSGKGADVVMIDVGLDIKGLIDSLEAEHIVIPVVACGVATDAKSAVRAIRAGAKEYIPLPPDPELIAAVLAAITQESHTLIFRDPAMARVLKIADQVAGSDASILITGESGTGKEVVARYLHRKSKRADKNFVAVNCAAIPENLLESELFGHEKGAFTGAVSRRIGKFEEASGGTLLLDEVSEMDTRLQAKLLRVIQEREIDRVGGSQPVKVDVRLIATSNRNLEEEVRKRTFREDLYFRLNVVNLALPPLRERPQDIDVLVNHFVKLHAGANGLPTRFLSAPALELVRRHPWRGNVRELENAMHRAVLLASGEEIGTDAILLGGDLFGIGGGAARHDAAFNGGIPSAPSSATSIASSLVGRTVADVERDLIIDTLKHCIGNRTHAATILGISIRTLRNKLKLYNDEGHPASSPDDGDHASA